MTQDLVRLQLGMTSDTKARSWSELLRDECPPIGIMLKLTCRASLCSLLFFMTQLLNLFSLLPFNIFHH